jgi:hypothetical protein
LIVSVLARVHDRLTSLASELRSKPDVRSVSVAVTPRQYPAGDRVECYVDAELASGHGLGCWLEFRSADGSWIIESSIRHNTREGEDELVGLATRYAVDDDELAAELDGASAALVDAALRVDLAGL